MDPETYIQQTVQQMTERLDLTPSTVRTALTRYEGAASHPDDAPQWTGPLLMLLRYQRSARSTRGVTRIEGVSLLSMRDEKTCEACFAADGTRYSLEEAMRVNPLPHPDCTNRPCRCTYRPILNMESE